MKLKELICFSTIFLGSNLAYSAAHDGTNPFGSTRLSLEQSLEKRRLLSEQLTRESKKVEVFLKDSEAVERARFRWKEDYGAATPAAKFGLFPGKTRTDSTSSGGSK